MNSIFVVQFTSVLSRDSSPPKGCRLARCHAVGMSTERVTQLHEQTKQRRRQHDQMIESSRALAHGYQAEYTISEDLMSFFNYYCNGVQLCISANN